MLSANVELVRSIFAPYGRGDFSSAEWAHSDIECVIADGPSPGSWRGRAAMAEAFRDWFSAWEDVRVEVEEYRELEDERVLALYHVVSGRGKTSGLEIGPALTRHASLFHIRDGKVTRYVTYWDRGRALADLGLAPEADATD